MTGLFFQNPGALGWLLLAVPIIAVHLYRGRQRRWAVPYLPLWEQILQADEMRSGLKNLRQWISLLLSLAALTAGVGTLSRPRLEGTSRRPEATVLLLDDTISLSAAGAGVASPEAASRWTVFDRAREDCRQVLENSDPEDAFAIVPAGRGSGAGTPVTADREVLDRFLDGLSPRARAVDWAGASALAAELLRGRSPARIVLVTDGARLAAVPAAIEGIPVLVHRVGGATDNRGFVDGTLHRPWGGHAATALVRVAAGSFQSPVSRFPSPGVPSEPETGNRKLETEVEVRVNGRLIRTEPLPPGDGPEAAVDVPLEEPGEARVQVEFRDPDALGIDDAAYFIAPSRERARMVVVRTGETQLFLVKAASVLEAYYDPVGSFAVSPADLPAYVPRLRGRDVLVFDGAVPPPLLREGLAVIFTDDPGAFPDASVPREGAVLESPAVVYQADDDPRLGLVDLRPLRMRRARWLAPRPGEQVLAAVLSAAAPAQSPDQKPETGNPSMGLETGRKPETAGALPLAVAGRAGDLDYLLFGFRIEETNLGVLPSFPILFRNLVEKGLEEAGRRFPRQGRVGEPLVALRPLPPGSGPLRVTWTDGGGGEETWDLPLDGGPVAVVRTERPGFYRIEGHGFADWCAVNLFDEVESDVRPSPLLRIPEGQLFRIPPPRSWHRRLPREWPWAAAAMGILALQVALSVKGIL